MDLGHWEFDQEFNIDDWFGFIYRIIEINTGREYIGKKQFFMHIRKAVKGRVNKRRIKKESDWKSYAGSSEHLKKAIEQNEKQNYKFKIESLHKTRASLYYAEVRTHVLEDVLRTKLDDNITPKYYNKQISGVRFIPPEEHTEETKMKTSIKLTDRLSIDSSWRNNLSEEELKLLSDQHYTGDNKYLLQLLKNKVLTENVDDLEHISAQQLFMSIFKK